MGRLYIEKKCIGLSLLMYVGKKEKKEVAHAFYIVMTLILDTKSPCLAAIV